MNQGTLIRALSQEFFLTQKETAAILHSLINRITAALSKGDRVSLRGFGSFTRKTHAAKKVRHPKTGEIITIPQRTTIHFNPSR